MLFTDQLFEWWEECMQRSCSLWCVCFKSLQSCPTLCEPMDCSPPSSSVQGFSRQEYWNGSPCPPPRDLPDPGIEPGFPTLQADSLLLSHHTSPAAYGSTGYMGNLCCGGVRRWPSCAAACPISMRLPFISH